MSRGAGETPFRALLVANRGEIALRIMRTARARGLSCIAVHTDADAGAGFVAFADRAVRIGAGPVADSYLSIEALLAAARESGAEAVHPGYGFLSENADFARAVQAAGLVWVGPPPEAIAAMGDKTRARQLMAGAGVPVIPGFDGDDGDDAALIAAAEQIGFPLMVKAALGGGGRGMRRVGAPAELGPAIGEARAEAQAAFGSDRLLLERALDRVRHVEVQVFADRHGNALHLGERDCSLQRRHQKVIEEAPSPAVDAPLRAALGEAALTAVRALPYEGAGTVEFLLAPDRSFHFLEMNTRLQVEHPVTEAVTGLDLVALQLDIAAGRALPMRQGDIRIDGHAIEARLYAEDPDAGFLPAAGRMLRWRLPAGEGLRIDAGLAEGETVSAEYDPMLAKLIAHGPDRETARRRLVAALGDSVLFGPPTNRDFLIALLEHPDFAGGQVDTGFIPVHFPADARGPRRPAFGDLAALAALWLRGRQQQALCRAGAHVAPLLGFSSSGALNSRLTLRSGGEEIALTLRLARDGRLEVGDGAQSAELRWQGDGLRIDGRTRAVGDFLETDDRLFAVLDGRTLALDKAGGGAAATDAGAGGRLCAPMHGRLVSLDVAAGERVRAGQPLAVLEAMKMQHVLKAGADGTVAALLAEPGAQLAAGAAILEIEADD